MHHDSLKQSSASFFSEVAPQGQSLEEAAVQGIVARACPRENYVGKKVILIVPDATRSAPVGLMFKLLHSQLASVTNALDVLIALGTHPPMSEEAIQKRLEITSEERNSIYQRVRFFNHAWHDPKALRTIGTIPAEEIHRLSDGLFSMDVSVQVNRLIDNYDQIIIVGPVFPHEVVGFSGGNKYLFPGISGPEVLNFFHWLGAVVTNPKIIGNKWTPVRQVIDRAGSMVTQNKLCFCLVVEKKQFAGVFVGSPESAWDAASELSRQFHITYQSKPFSLILSCAPEMYDELWVAGKCMYKLEPILADGGELIIYAPHLKKISETHGHLIEKVGYHCRDYFLKQWNQFKDYPWSVLAHSTHVFGGGTYERGKETPRARITLATQIPKDLCHRINLGYRDPNTIRLEEYQNREANGIFVVPQAGERLFRLRD